MYTRAKIYLAAEQNGNSGTLADEKKLSAPLFRCMRSSPLPAHEKGLHRLAQEAFAVVVAGGETTARMLELGTFYILDSPLVLQRFKDELSKVMPDVAKIPSSKALEEVPYIVSQNPACSRVPVSSMLKILQVAVVKEILRISAMVTSRLPLMAEEELRYGDWVIPRKVSLCRPQHGVWQQKTFSKLTLCRHLSA